MKKLNIKMKILLPTIALVIVGFTILTTVTMLQFSSTSTELQDKYAEEFAFHTLFKVKSILEVPLDEARSLAVAFGEAQKEKAMDREDVTGILEAWLDENDTYFGVYTAWEPDAFDGLDSQFVNKKYHDSTGRFVPYLVKDGNKIEKEALVGYDTDAYYQDPRSTRKEVIIDPYDYERNGNTYLIVSMVVPIVVDGQFMGIVGVDILMDELQALSEDTKLFDNGYISVLASNAKAVAHKNHAVINSDVAKYFDTDSATKIVNSINNGSVYATNNISAASGVESHVVFASTEMGNTGSNWCVLVSVPLSELGASTNRGIKIGIILAILFVLLIIGILVILVQFLISKPITGSINQIQNSASQVSYSSKQLSESSQQLSEGATEQAAAIEETSATMDETSSMVKQNAENTRQANNLSKEASKAAEVGSSRMQEMTSSMEELKKSSGDISKIIKVIDEIAFQTNMLALNAAVEAARAGDAGQGFAVVAEEVRNLAQKSAKAAKDTAEIIDRNIELSERGVAISTDVNDSLEEIMQKTNDVNQLIEEISAASDEQAKGTAQVTEAIGQMEIVVQSNAASSEESAASAEELRTQASMLERIVLELDEMIKGQGNESKISSNNTGQQDRIASSNSTNNRRKIDAGNTSRKHIMAADDVIPLDDDEFLNNLKNR